MILPREEWSRLEDTELKGVWRELPPSSTVLVVERDGAIVGHWVLMPIWHVEFLKAETTGIARSLYVEMCAATKDAGAQAVCTGAISDDVRGLLDHAGAKKLDGDHYVWPIHGAAVLG